MVYSKWIVAKFLEKIRPFNQKKSFPFSSNETNCVFCNFQNRLLFNSVVTAVEDDIPFFVVTDAPESIITATLPQPECPVAAFSV